MNVWQCVQNVGDSQAPGYSEVIKRPMSFAQMRERLAAGDYTAWIIVQQDLETMFNNAMVFNAPASVYHQKARPWSSHPSQGSLSMTTCLSTFPSGHALSLKDGCKL